MVAVARACEEAGIEGLVRSDHYTSVHGHRERGSLVVRLLASLPR